jgi:serine/threonine-protein kinase
MATSLPEDYPTRDERPKRRGRGWMVAIALAFMTVAGVLAFQLAPRRNAAPATPPVTPVEGVTTAPSAAVITPVPSAATPPPPPLIASPSSQPSPPPFPAASSAAASKPASAHPRRVPKAKCDPPYTLDADGFKHYDPRCF